MVAPDLRGFGESSRPREEEAYKLRAVQADVVALLDALGVRECAAGAGRTGPVQQRSTLCLSLCEKHAPCLHVNVDCRRDSTAFECGRPKNLPRSNSPLRPISRMQNPDPCVHRFSLVGHDWGSALAWRMAGSLAGRVRRLVAISVGHPGAPAAAAV